MQKKDTTAPKAGAPRKAKTIRQRAQAIIANKRRYDSDTREAIFNATVKKHADLEDCVIRAERGEPILDLTNEQAKFEIAAQYIIDLYVVERIPDFIADAVTDALSKAASVKGVNIRQPYKDGDPELSRRGLADLFAVSKMLSLDPPPSSSLVALAEHLSAVFTHPDTPVAMYNALADVLNDLDKPRGYFDSAAYIELCLRANAKATRKGGAR